MKSFNQVARVMYAAYCKRLGVDPAAGRKLLGWTEIGVESQAAWIEAAKARTDELENIH